MKTNNYIILLLILIMNFSAADVPIGACIRDPNAQKLQNEWKHYLELTTRKAKINIKLMAKTIRMDSETMRLLQAVSETEVLMSVLDDLEVNYLKKAFVDIRFNEMISSPDFIEKLLSKKMDQEIRNSDLKFKNDQNFYDLLDKIRNEMSKAEVKDAMDIFRTYDLGILEINYRKSARSALRMIRKKGANVEVVRSWIKDPPFLKNIPLPADKLGPFAVKYRSLLVKSITNFVLNRKISLIEAKKINYKIKQGEVDEMNSILPPTENNSFDDYIYQAGNDQKSAIDGVVRTLWGEATSCQIQGLPQFEAIGKIIADRSMAVCRAIEEQSDLNKKNVEVREKNWTTFLSNWAGISRPAPGMQNKAYAKLKGLSDFGRKEKSNIHCAAQVISKKNQFSVWNSYSLKKFQTGKLNKNIPNVTYEIQGPQAENDDKALIRILCPEMKTTEQLKLWEYAVLLSTEIVKSPETFTKKIVWPVSGDIYFYTHEASLPFAKEIKLKNIIINKTLTTLSKKGRGACNNFRLFTPKVKTQY